MVFGLLFAGAVPAGAGALDPTAFAPVGPFPTAAGTYTFDTSNLTLNGPSGALTGVDYNGIAVFDFTTITVNSGQVFLGMGTLPLALLSRSDISVNGTIDVSGSQGVYGFGSPNGYMSVPGGPGGFGSSAGPGAGANGIYSENITTGFNYAISPGGGGFGGRGGNGGFRALTPEGPILIPSGGGGGGGSYGNLAISLQGGSGGGSLPTVRFSSSGGGGGGAIEVGAVGAITVSGNILANGGNGGGGNGGGGSGGGIFLHGDSVALSGVLSAQGGGGYVTSGGGGGGQVLIQTGPGGFSGNVAEINVSGGAGTMVGSYPFGAAGDPGLVTVSGIVFSAVPEPASMMLLGIGLLGLLGCARYARLRAAA